MFLAESLRACKAICLLQYECLGAFIYGRGPGPASETDNNCFISYNLNKTLYQHRLHMRHYTFEIVLGDYMANVIIIIRHLFEIKLFEGDRKYHLRPFSTVVVDYDGIWTGPIFTAHTSIGRFVKPPVSSTLVG